ncbi:MAG: STAS domain-containing protein [Ignavibacteriales bacterium]|nr:STAS domain-containing protein [Ignavibacteriales bacterium]
MKVKIHEKYDAVVVELKGNIMGSDETKEFHSTVRKLLEEEKKNIVVDLGEVKFMNSTGLGMLISGYTTIKNGGGAMVICNTTEKIESLLVITKLITIFDNFNSVDEAVESFKKK